MTTLEDLRQSFETRLRELAAMPTTREHHDDFIRPSDILLDRARIVAESLLASPYCRLGVVHISAGHDDQVLFSLTGSNGRDCDLWVHNDTDGEYKIGNAHWVAGDKTEEYDCYLPYERCGELLPWLFGDGPLP